MARKVQRNAPAAAEDTSAADAVSALKPDASVTIAGRAITVREYGYFEGLEVAHRAAAFIGDLLAMARGGELRFANARRLFGVHADVVVAIAAQAADVEPAWVRNLAPAEAEAFMATWFAVHVPFFMREVVNELQEEVQLRLMASRSTGSLSDSPAPDSATSTGLDDSQSAS